MSIFETLKNAIFGHAQQPAATAGAPPTASAAAGGQTAAPATAGVGASAPSGSPGTASSGVDVAAILDGLKAKNGQNLNWRTSIVDLMKLVGMDSSLEHRKELAKELGYTGDSGDSAAMNIWLHKQVMTRLAQNGGKVPDSLLH
jgi:Domain of unknown function (DUF3597)